MAPIVGSQLPSSVLEVKQDTNSACEEGKCWAAWKEQVKLHIADLRRETRFLNVITEVSQEQEYYFRCNQNVAFHDAQECWAC